MSTRRMNQDILEIQVENKTVLFIAERAEGELMQMRISGEISNAAAHDFEDELITALTVCRKIVLDLEEVTYIASLGMKALLSVQQIIDENPGSELCIAKMSPQVREIFEDAGFTEILNIEEAAESTT